MAIILNATLNSGLSVVPDNSGQIQLQSNGTTIATVTPTGITTQVGAPAFSAYSASGTTLTNNAWTKVTFDTEEFDDFESYSEKYPASFCVCSE